MEYMNMWSLHVYASTIPPAYINHVSLGTQEHEVELEAQTSKVTANSEEKELWGLV
jgi:hypothetical protein